MFGKNDERDREIMVLAGIVKELILARNEGSYRWNNNYFIDDGGLDVNSKE